MDSILAAPATTTDRARPAQLPGTGSALRLSSRLIVAGPRTHSSSDRYLGEISVFRVLITGAECRDLPVQL